MHNYPSNITREEFETIRADLENAQKTTKPRETDLYDIFCAILYLIKSGRQWRMLPSDFPKWRIVRYYYDVWSKEREDKTTFGIIDAQSVQNADTAEEKGYDADKKVSGIKRHIVVDTIGTSSRNYHYNG